MTNLESQKMEKPRYLALDVLRGLTVCIMIVVNTSGAGAEPFAILQHAKWFGFTLADVVFPTFLFVVGNALCFTTRPGGSERDALLKILKRTAIIFLLGFLMYWFPFFHQIADGSWAFNPLAETRIMGVLQRIALCYGVCAVCVRYLTVRQIVILCGVLLLAYWAMLMAFGPPGEQLSPLGNIGAQVDRAVLGLQHMYRKGHGYDPEGLFSTLPALVNVLAGYLAGRFLVGRTVDRKTVTTLLIAGAALVIAGLAWSLPTPVGFPLAKRLWTSSFVLLTIGIDLVVLAGLIAYTGLAGQTFGVRFCQVFGKNALAIYLFSELFVTVLQLIKTPQGMGLYDWVGIELFQKLAPGAIGSLLCAVAYMLVCWGLGYVLDRRNILIKI